MKTVLAFKSNINKREELNDENANILNQEMTPLSDILRRKKSPITQLAEVSKTRYTKDLEKLRQKALKML
ncbi:hypothetical protein SH601_07905 [Gracilibacillus sp. S3-1-1]|uniref:Uncharacterized protein n=1 Tax=Gracilibacillus pellucidus TaxID=3095368 RepID=A0ACC6M4M0_9BACI|nr:hypothetical protein [Gracilibacillus sp. S3-1-1]MDX8045915.1 hypothetical protein [Gracilibacillus sp. S3-1-1]